MRRLVFSTILSILLISSSNAQMKQWTDEKGVTHFEGQSPPANKPQPKEEKIHCPVSWPDPGKRHEEGRYRQLVAATLADLKNCHAKVEGDFYIDDLNLQRAALGASSTRRIEIEGRRRINSLEKIRTQAPLHEKLLLIEKEIKERYNGALPDWVKDNRDWRYLDKAFSP